MANKKKGTGEKGKAPAKTTAKKAEQQVTTDSKVVKFEKKSEKPAFDFEGQITQIKIPVKKEIPFIMYNKQTDRGTKEVTFKNGGRPMDSFIAALQSLVPYFLNVVEIPNKADETVITGVHFTKAGIIISGQIELKENGIDASIPVNTPSLKLENENGYEVPEYAKNLINEVKRQAVLYMNGDEKEKQMDIPGIKEG